MRQNKIIWVIGSIVVVNAIGYGIIFPILYTYSQKFGLSDFQNGLLFSVFSLCQFLATPVIGRLSDRFGRKPLLLISLAGTAVSFLLMAWAQNAWWLFIARALDGMTAGNLPVASAVISDSMDVKNRARGFGMIGAAFGLGFIFGPAISGLTVGWGLAVPFLVAGGITLISLALTAFVLPETHVHRGKTAAVGQGFHWQKLLQAAFDPQLGPTLTASFVYTLAFAVYIYAFQPFAVKTLRLTPSQISWIFMIIGLVGVIVQVGLLSRLIKWFGERRLLTYACLVAGVVLVSIFFVKSFLGLVLGAGLIQLANALTNLLIQALLSREVDEQGQGSIMGLNAAYQSLGFILGPIFGGLAATAFITLPFVVAGGFAICAFWLLAAYTHRIHRVSID